MRPLLSQTDDRFSTTTGTTHNTISTISNNTAYFRPASPSERDSTLPLRLLSIDGGGIHGYATLLQIQELMLSLFVSLHNRYPRTDELPRPCDHFDLIGGTGTGGLIALLLGRLRLDIESAKAAYGRISRDSLRSENTLIGLPVKKTLFKATKFEASLKDAISTALATPIVTGGGVQPSDSSKSAGSSITANGGSSTTASKPKLGRNNYQPLFKSVSNPASIGKLPFSPAATKKGDSETLLYDPSPTRCRVFVTAVHKGSAHLLLLRSYDAAGSRWRIWEAARATCASPPFFKALTIENNIFLGDGGSPVAAVVEEAISREFPGRDVGVLVSIGSGSPRGNEAEKAHLQLLRSGYLDPRNCYRLDPARDASEYGNEWDRYREIAERVKRYTASQEARDMITDAAGKMAGIAMLKMMPVDGEVEGKGEGVMLFNRHREMGKKVVSDEFWGLELGIGDEEEDAVVSDLEEDEEVMAHLEQLREITRRMYAAAQ